MTRAILPLLLSFAAAAQPLSQTVRAGEVTFTVRVTPEKPVVGDVVHLDLEVSAPQSMRVELPDDPGFLDCAVILDRESAPAENSRGRTTYRGSFLLDPSGAGACHVPALSVHYDADVITSQPVAFAIASLIPPEETNPDIRDGQTPLAPAEHPVNWVWVALATLLVLAVVAWFTFGGRPAKLRRLEGESAEVRARRRLARLSLSPSPVPREFYTELSQILTAYLDERLGLRSTRCTSPEMLAAVQRTGLMTQEGRDLLAALLEDCDYAKFSAACPLGDNPQEAVECCRQIIDVLSSQMAARTARSKAAQELTRA